jgi:hypothetical protein
MYFMAAGERGSPDQEESEIQLDPGSLGDHLAHGSQPCGWAGRAPPRPQALGRSGEGPRLSISKKLPGAAGGR